MMIVMVGNLLIAFGMLAVFGMIHFRNVLKDTRDTTFILWSVMEGATIGTMRFSTALVAAAGIGAAYLYCRLVSFGTRHRYDAVVTLRIAGELLATGATLKQILYCHASSPADQRAAGQRGRGGHGLPPADARIPRGSTNCRRRGRGRRGWRTWPFSPTTTKRKSDRIGNSRLLALPAGKNAAIAAFS